MQGIWTALVTPFDDQKNLDLASFRKILHDQIDAKVSGVIPCGTTGEAPALTLEEKKILILATLEELRGTGIRVVAGTGTNNTAETIEISQWASRKKVDGVLIVTPYYNKPSQEGLIEHFTSIADQVDCEVMLYNVPGRTGISLTPETITHLSFHPKITSLKEATGNVAFSSEILDHLSAARANLDLLAGDDATFLPLLSIGAKGIVSVASNLFPRAMVALYTAQKNGQIDLARNLHQRYYPLFRDLFIESNPVPIKQALALAGWCQPHVRLPLVSMKKANIEKLQDSFTRCELLKGQPA